MKKTLAFILAVMVFTAVGCKPKTVEETVSIGDFKKISLSEEIVISPLDELPVELSKIKIPVFETHDIIGIDFDNYQGQVPDVVPPRTSDGYVADYYVCDGYAYYVVTYDYFYFGGYLSQDICIYEQNLETENVDIIYTYKNTKTLMGIISPIKIDRVLYWTEYYVDKYKINADPNMSYSNIVSYSLESREKTVIYESDSSVARNIPHIQISESGFQWSEERFKAEEVIDPETKELLKRELTQTTYEYNIKTGKISELVHIENYFMRTYDDDYTNDNYIDRSGVLPIYPSEYKTTAQFNAESLIEFVRNTPSEKTTVKTDYKSVDYVSQTKDTVSWIDWPVMYGGFYHDNPIINILDYKNTTIKTFEGEKIGYLSSALMKNQLLFIYYSTDRIIDESNDSGIENIYMVDTESGKIFNLTNSTVINTDSDKNELRFFSLTKQGDYIYFYSMRKDNAQTPDRYYDYLYYIKV